MELNRFSNWKSRWSEADLKDEWDYINETIHPEDFLLLSKLLNPELIEYEGLIFLQRNFSETVYLSLSRTNRQGIQKDINSIKVFELFDACSEIVNDATFEAIGKFIQQSWTDYLKRTFPERNFIVELIIDTCNYGPILRFYQEFENR